MSTDFLLNLIVAIPVSIIFAYAGYILASKVMDDDDYS